MTPERRKEIIEFLKGNRVPYYLWTDEERLVADAIERRWWLVDFNDDAKFVDCDNDLSDRLGGSHGAKNIYRLKPEYQDEPKAGWDKYSVVDFGGHFGIMFFDVTRGDIRYRLDGVTSRIGFGGIMYEDCPCGKLVEHFWAGKFHMEPPIPCEKHGPHKPVKVRFWRQK